jgi:DNA-binding beta-propeller fold protein YncE
MKLEGATRSLRAIAALGGVALLVVGGLAPHVAYAQGGLQRGGTPQTDRVPPVNGATQPHPYRVVRDWAQLTLERRPWGGTNAVDIDRDGKTVWVTDRCTMPISPGCLGTSSNPIHHFDETGREIKSFGAGMFVWAHGLHVDRDGNVWVADARLPTSDELTKFPEARNKGSAVYKFNTDGELLLTLGTPGALGDPPNALSEPTAVITDPANGDVYVAESHMSVTEPNLVGRISVFDKNGKFLRAIGKAGMNPGEFRTPHAIAFDSKGNLVVADRQNHRVQIVTKTGEFLREYADFSRVSGLIVDANDAIYATDSESNDSVHPGWSRGVRIGSAEDGRVTMFIPPHETSSPDGAMGEGIAIDPAGNLYTAESILGGVTKYVREQR